MILMAGLSLVGWFWKSEEVGNNHIITLIVPRPARTCTYIRRNGSREAGMYGFDQGWSKISRYKTIYGRIPGDD
jgi:hypothetical protein